MEAALKLWTVILAVGVLNYLSRLSFIALFARGTIPPLLARALRYVPAAMLTALILPMIVDWHGAVADFATPRVAAAVIATAVAFVTRNTLATLGAGMAALWLLQWALG
jgi:branched-subunit amino acid transport protein